MRQRGGGERERETETETDSDRETGTQRERDTDRQTDRQTDRGMGVDTWGYKIASSKHYLVGKCVMNGRHNMAERCRRVTVTKFRMQ